VAIGEVRSIDRDQTGPQPAWEEILDAFEEEMARLRRESRETVERARRTRERIQRERAERHARKLGIA
jgi:vacuolar-type H+-ATPase subunit E/Vma4